MQVSSFIIERLSDHDLFHALVSEPRKPKQPRRQRRVSGLYQKSLFNIIDLKAIGALDSFVGPGVARHVEIRGDGQQIRDYLYIDDAARGLVHIAEYGEAGQDYNLASGVPVRLLDLAHQIAVLMGHPEIAVVPTGEASPGDVPKWYADVRKIRRIGFTPQVSFEEGLLRTICYLL